MQKTVNRLEWLFAWTKIFFNVLTNIIIITLFVYRTIVRFLSMIHNEQFVTGGSI